MERWAIRETVCGQYLRHVNTGGPCPGGWCQFEYRLRFDLAVEGIEVVPVASAELVHSEHFESLKKGVERGWSELRKQSQLVTSLVVEIGRIDQHPFDIRMIGSIHGLCLLLDEAHRHGVRTRPLEPGWRTPTVVALAAVMYEARDFGATPVLADALEETGCDHADVLAHCRGPGPHAGGCWVVDLVLGKQ